MHAYIISHVKIVSKAAQELAPCIILARVLTPPPPASTMNHPSVYNHPTPLWLQKKGSCHHLRHAAALATNGLHVLRLSCSPTQRVASCYNGEEGKRS